MVAVVLITSYVLPPSWITACFALCIGVLLVLAIQEAIVTYRISPTRWQLLWSVLGALGGGAVLSIAFYWPYGWFGHFWSMLLLLVLARAE